MKPDEYHNHEMDLVQTHSDGRDEFLCPICKRHFLIDWSGMSSKIILEEGDARYQHSGGNGNKWFTETGLLGYEGHTLSGFLHFGKIELDITSDNQSDYDLFTQLFGEAVSASMRKQQGEENTPRDLNEGLTEKDDPRLVVFAEFVDKLNLGDL